MDMDGEILYDVKQKTLWTMKEFDRMRKSKLHCDFIIKVGNEAIPVHRLILIASSKYFEGMLSHDTLENQQGYVELKGVDAECVKFSIDFMYCGKLSITEAKLEEFCCVVDIFQIHTLLDSLVSFLQGKLTSKTFFIIKKLADKHSYASLMKICDSYALKNFKLISSQDGFSALDSEYLSFLMQSGLNRESETLKLMALLEWTRFDVENRRPVLHSVIEKFQLSEIPLNHRRYLMEKEPLTSQSPEIVKLLCTSVLDDLNARSENLCIPSEPNCILAFDDTSRHLTCFDPVTNTCTKMNRLQDDLKQDNFTPIMLGGSLFVLMESREVYRLVTLSADAPWEKTVDMLLDHGNWPPCVADARYIYAVGKWTKGPKTSGKIERFDPVANEWLVISNENVTGGASVLLVEKQIYCMGGSGFQGHVRLAQTFDLVSHEWSKVASLLKPRCFAAVTSHNEKIYIMGGQTWYNQIESSLECYDRETNIWTLLSPMSLSRTELNDFTFGDVIYAVCKDFKNQSSIKKYEIAKDRWTKLNLTHSMNILWSVAATIHEKIIREHISATGI